MNTQEIRRVLFLDIDGVLNSSTFLESWAGDAPLSAKCQGVLDPTAVRMITDLMVYCDAHVVISSTWRILNTVDDIRSDLMAAGGLHHVIGAIDRKSAGSVGRFGRNHRGLQIQRWLDAHPEVERFAIVDDDGDMGELMPYLVKTCASHGLQEHHVAALSHLLGRVYSAKRREPPPTLQERIEAAKARAASAQNSLDGFDEHHWMQRAALKSRTEGAMIELTALLNEQSS